MTNSELRSAIADHIQHLIDSADDNVSQDFIAGLETALAVVTDTIDARSKDLKSA